MLAATTTATAQVPVNPHAKISSLACCQPSSGPVNTPLIQRVGEGLRFRASVRPDWWVVVACYPVRRQQPPARLHQLLSICQLYS